jgi:cellulose biosynthesis protein BcsQ
VQFMAQAAQDLRDGHGRGPRLLGIVPNMVRYTKEHREQMTALVGTFGAAVWPPVPLSVRVAEACGYGQVLFDHAPKERVTRAVGLVGKRFLQNVGSGD